MKSAINRSADLFAGFYRGKRVLVTGDTGFKGSWLALWLHELGAQVSGLALAPHTSPSHFELTSLDSKIRHFNADIRNEHAVKQCFESARPQLVFHLAAQALVRNSYDDPKTTFDTNVGGTVNVLEAIRTSPGVRAAVIITSDKCYQNNEWIWGYRETDPLGGHDPYSASKGATEIVTAAYRSSYFDRHGQGPHVGLATVRAGNVIGGGDWAKDRIIPDCIRALETGQPLVIRNPKSTRPWQHVLDPLCGYLLLATKLWKDNSEFSGAWNFGPAVSDQITVETLAKQFIKTWGNGVIKASNGNKAPHEARLLNLNTDKASLKLAWKPVLDSVSAVDWTAEWYKSMQRGDVNPQDISIGQITQFAVMARNRRGSQHVPETLNKIQMGDRQ